LPGCRSGTLDVYAHGAHPRTPEPCLELLMMTNDLLKEDAS
jgi:hypothetical protein